MGGHIKRRSFVPDTKESDDVTDVTISTDFTEVEIMPTSDDSLASNENEESVRVINGRLQSEDSLFGSAANPSNMGIERHDLGEWYSLCGKFPQHL